MNINKAIKLLKETIVRANYDALYDHVDALKLGIEALKFRQDWEAQVRTFDFILLPGETEE